MAHILTSDEMDKWDAQVDEREMDIVNTLDHLKALRVWTNYLVKFLHHPDVVNALKHGDPALIGYGFKALDNLYRVLKPRGRLIIAHAISSNESNVHHRSASSAVASDVLPEEPEMRQLLQHAGFVEISINDEPGYYLCLSTKPWGEDNG